MILGTTMMLWLAEGDGMHPNIVGFLMCILMEYFVLTDLYIYGEPP